MDIHPSQESICKSRRYPESPVPKLFPYASRDAHAKKKGIRKSSQPEENAAMQMETGMVVASVVVVVRGVVVLFFPFLRLLELFFPHVVRQVMV